MMVDTDGISGIEINSNRTVTNGLGIAVIPSLSNYTTSMLRVNNNDLPEGVDVVKLGYSHHAHPGCHRLRKTECHHRLPNRSALFVARKMGASLHEGVNVTDKATGKDVGLVAEDGLFVYLSGIQENSTLHLTWGDNTCEVTPPNQSNISESAIILPCKTVRNDSG